MTWENAVKVLQSGGRVRHRNWYPTTELVLENSTMVVHLGTGDSYPYEPNDKYRKSTGWEEVSTDGS